MIIYNGDVEILDTPEKCRDFIKRTEIDGKKITAFQQEDGKVVSVDEASDDQVLQVAKAIAEALNASRSH